MRFPKALRDRGLEDGTPSVFKSPGFVPQIPGVRCATPGCEMELLRSSGGREFVFRNRRSRLITLSGFRIVSISDVVWQSP
jgi:hypothetical protein